MQAARGAAESTEELCRAVPPSFATCIKVIIVDDDENQLEALRTRLEMCCHEVVCCTSAEEALEQLRVGARPDVIILDLVMPDMNGWQFRLEQKKDPELATIPVIVVSGDRSAQAAAIDAAAYLSKPLDDRLLLTTIERVTRARQASRSEARAKELERLLSLGELVGGIAHEINNPLTSIFGGIDILQRQLIGLACPTRAVEPLTVASALRAVERAKLGAERIAAVVRSASMFALADLETVVAIDVHEVLESSLQIAANEIRLGAHLVRSYEDIPRVLGNPAKLGQVFLNLLLNAIDSIRHDRPASDQVIRVATYLDDDWVTIAIADSAALLDGSSMAAIFDPVGAEGRLHFGLAVSREVVDELGGTIEVEAGEPKGALFRVRIPAYTRDSYPAPRPRPPIKLASQRPSVLLVDDEPIMCELLATMLSGIYEVAAFTSPRAALARLLDGEFDVVLCDVAMPELNGFELFRRAIRERSELAERFVFISGGAFTERVRLFLEQTGRPVLRKPCERAELLEAVRRAATSQASERTH